MREVMLDTETTGLKPDEGHRIVEIGCVELRNRVPTGARFHRYVNPEREIPEEVSKIHGLTQADLEGKPLFCDIADDLLEFLGDSDTIVIHNAEFDLPFVNMELVRAGKLEIPKSRVIDTLEMARKDPRSQSNSLDGLCRRFNINTARRKARHGALLDAELLAEVYIDLTDSRMPDLDLDEPALTAAAGLKTGPRSEPLPSLLTSEEKAQHAQLLKDLGETPIWHDYLTEEGELRT